MQTPLKLLRTNSAYPDFISLVHLLDQDLAQRDGEEHAFYAQYNKVPNLNTVVVAYQNDTPVACGAIKEWDESTMEVKRMYVPPSFRNQGIAALVLAELEAWTKELHYNRCILETGIKQPEAIRLYQKCGYQIIPNYGQYSGVSNSVCFEKRLY